MQFICEDMSEPRSRKFVRDGEQIIRDDKFSHLTFLSKHSKIPSTQHPLHDLSE